MATNKNDDHIHAEILQFDSAVYARYHERAGSIIYAQDPPPKINNSPAFFKCKWCSQSPVCHKPNPEVEVNCRTCDQSSPLENGTWICKLHSRVLSKEDQKAACQSWDKHPTFISK